MINFLLSTAQDPRVAFQIGGLTVQWYGLLIVLGMLLGLVYACWQAKKIGISSDDAVELFLWLIPLAIVFARLLYVIPRADEYFVIVSFVRGHQFVTWYNLNSGR